ncbi:hypothetical protein C0995_002185 [Termitomyces sp. Mi166|nr:hypothetical protein C0995_002185 [Termitomyces sp. Mi166\
MGAATLINSALTANQAWSFAGTGFLYTLWALWWVDLALSFLCAFGMLYVMMTTQSHRLTRMASLWVLPMVTLIVASSTGGLLANAFINHSIYRSLITTGVSVTALITGLSLALMILTVYLARLVLYGPPDPSLILSAFITLGPLGQGGFSLLLAGQNLSVLLPLHLGDRFPNAALTGDFLHSVCFCGAWILWSMGIAWTAISVISVYAVVRIQRIPFTVAYWGLIFPTGVFGLLSVELGEVLDNPFFHYFGTIWSMAALPKPMEQRAQCQATLNIASSVASTLQSTYFDAGTGQYNGGSLWTDANTLEDLHNLMLATGTDQFSTVADTSYIGRSALNSNTNWQSVLAGSNDDAGNTASKIYNIIAAQWDNTCGGGVWWSTAHTYKNAITNELFLLLSAEGYLRGGGQTYLNNALKLIPVSGSGMRNSQNLWNDGLNFDNCQNNGQTTWTYNQGVIASGLGALYAATGNSSLLTQAELTLDATIAHLSTNNILRESCDDAVAGGPVCNQDQQIFKGIWTKHLQFYLDRANDPVRVAKYSSWLGSQTSAVYHYGTNANNIVGSVWYAPDQGGSIFTPKTDASGLAAHIAAAKYGPC